MLRIILGLIGAAFCGVLAIGLVSGAYSYVTEPSAETAEHAFHKHAKDLKLASDGPFGKYDRRQLQRGFQVYKEVCSACHSMRLVAFRDLQAIGYSEAEVKAIADQWAIQDPVDRSRHRRSDDAQVDPCRSLSVALPQRSRRARRKQQCVAARFLAHRQGP